MEYDSFLTLVKKRRTIRFFKTDPVPDEYVDKIIEAARFAPSGGNSQPWEFIVIKDQDIKDRIVDIVNDDRAYSRKLEVTREEKMRFPRGKGPGRKPGYKKAPVFIILCGDPRAKDLYPLLTTLTRGDSIFTSSLANAFLYMTLAVTTLGLGSQWVSATGGPLSSPFLKELLEIPQNLEVYDMLAVGYAAYKPQKRFVRDRAEVVHYDRFDKSKYKNDPEWRDLAARFR